MRERAALATTRTVLARLLAPGLPVPVDALRPVLATVDAVLDQNHRSGLPWRSGFRVPVLDPAKLVAALDAVGAWRGRDLDLTLLFIGRDSWSRDWGRLSDNPVTRGLLRAVHDTGRLVSLAVPLLIQAEARRFDRLAAGDFDAHHAALARRLRGILGGAPIYLRLGWEADEGYPWSWEEEGAADSTPDTEETAGLYKAAWRRIAGVYRAELPAARLVLNTLRNIRRPLGRYFPGGDVVDVLGMDPYNNGWATGYVCDEASWFRFCAGYDPATGWVRGPQGLIDFARAVGRRVSFCEWGTSNREGSPAAPANHAAYPSYMWSLFRSNADLLEYECYFHAALPNPHEIYPTSVYNPATSQSYRTLWSARVP